MDYDEMTTPELEEEMLRRGIPGYDEQKRSLLIEMLRDDDLSRHPAPPEPFVYLPHPETPEEIVESPQQIIDLMEYVDAPNREGMKASYELEGKTGPIPLRTFMNYFPPGISSIGVNKYDIIQTDEYRDNGLYFVYGRNGTLYVIQTPGNYSLPEQALPMLQEYSVRTQDDLYRIYGVQQGDLDLFGIQLGGEDYTFANDESEIGVEEGVYDPDNLPARIESRTAMPAYETTPRVYPKIMMPLTVIPSAPAPAVAPAPAPAVAPAPAPALTSMFPRIPKYDVPSFFGTKPKPKR